MSFATTIEKTSLADSVYRQLSDRILRGNLPAGEELPAERLLAEQLGINRGAVREGLKRLQQAGLIAVRHGGATQVLDWRTQAGLEALPQLLISVGNEINEQAVLGVMALRSALAPPIAAAAARNGDTALADELDARVKDIAGAKGPRQRQVQAHAFWAALVAGSSNIAFQLAFNSMDRTYRQIWNLLTVLLDVEFRDTLNLSAIALAVRAHDADGAARHAAAHVALGETALAGVIKSLKPNRS